MLVGLFLTHTYAIDMGNLISEKRKDIEIGKKQKS
jgi:hypothetical protein